MRSRDVKVASLADAPGRRCRGRRKRPPAPREQEGRPEVFYLPGGKPAPGESPEECVRREVREELGVELASLEFDHTIHAPAALEGVPMAMDVFRGELTGEPAAAAEIAAIAWHRPSEPFAGTLAPAIEALYASAPVWMRS